VISINELNEFVFLAQALEVGAYIQRQYRVKMSLSDPYSQIFRVQILPVLY